MWEIQEFIGLATKLACEPCVSLPHMEKLFQVFGINNRSHILRRVERNSAIAHWVIIVGTLIWSGDYDCCVVYSIHFLVNEVWASFEASDYNAAHDTHSLSLSKIDLRLFLQLQWLTFETPSIEYSLPLSWRLCTQEGTVHNVHQGMSQALWLLALHNELTRM